MPPKDATPVSPAVADLTQRVIPNVAKKRQEWARLDARTKVLLLEQCIALAKREYQAMAESTLTTRGGDKNDPRQQTFFGHAWAIGPMGFASWMSGLRDLWDHVATHGSLPPLKKPLDRPLGGQSVAVGPRDWSSWIAAGMPKFEIHSLPGTKISQGPAPTHAKGGLVAILGAGNYENPIDILSSLFIQGNVCVYKVNPVAVRIGPHLRNIFAPLIALDYLAIVDGGAAEGQAMIDHPAVDSWFITGAACTFNHIVWGQAACPGPQTALKPRVSKPVIAELGGATPMIVAPGKWNSLELKLHAGHLALQTSFNGGHVCVRPQVIVTCKKWKHREAFLSAVREQLGRAPAWRSFYPGTKDKMGRFAKELEKEGKRPADFLVVEPLATEVFGTADRHAMIFATDVSEDSYACREEAFCPVLVEVALDTPDEVPAFLEAAADFANKKLAGTLAANILCKTGSRADREALERCVDRLRYGVVGVNLNATNAIVFPELFWGAAPGASKENVESGIGIFGNMLGVENAHKAVVRGDFLNAGLVAQSIPSSPLSLQPLRLFRRLTFFFLERSAKQPVLSAVMWVAKVLSAALAGF